MGLPARTWVTDGTSTLTETLTLYDGASSYDTAPTVGIPTATRTWISGTQYSQTSMVHDDWGNVIEQTTWSGYGTATSAPSSGERTTYTCYGGSDGTGEYVGGKLCPNDGYHTYALWTKNPLGHETTITYDYALGLPLSETDPNGAETSVTYDVFGRFTSLTKPDTGSDISPAMTVEYDLSPFTVTLNLFIDATHTFEVIRYYDGLGRQYLTDTNDVLVESSFDAFGHAVSVSTPHTDTETAYDTVTTYDALGRLKTITPPDGAETTNVYDGLTTTVTDANDHTHTTETDIWGRTVSITPPTGPAVSFTYDPLGNMETASRGGATVTLDYDNAGRKVSMDDPDMGFWEYEYDALGSMTSQTDARDCTTNLTYDLLGRPLTKTYSNCPSTPGVTYVYDQGTNGIGRKHSVSDASGLTVWNYDIRGRITSEAKEFTGYTQFVTYYTYNSADLPVTMTYPDNEVVTFTYTNQMLLDSVVGTNTYVYDTQYDSASRMTSRELGNGLVQTYGYYAWNQQGGRLENLSTESLQNFTYEYDPVGNINSISDSVNSQTQTFEYDVLDRLVTAVATGTAQQGGYATETYGYDSTTGNLSSKAGVTYTYNSGHAHAVSSLSNGNSYVYDDNGNMTTRNVDDKSYTFTYDAENRLVSVSGDATASFTYNGDGQRVKSVMDGETTLFVGGHYEVTNPGASQTITKYYMAGASRIAIRKGTTLSYMLADHLGSTSLVTDTNGDRTSELRYKPWGETRFSFGTMPTKYTFTGQFSYKDDPSTEEVTEGFGLMYYGARWYDPSLSRFAQADIVVSGGTQGLDRYAYVLDNPVKYFDPTGHMADQGGDGNSGLISIQLLVTPMQQGLSYENDCGETAFAIAYNYAYGTDISREAVDKYAGSAKDKGGNPLYTKDTAPYTSPEHMADIADHYTYGNNQTGNVSNSYQGWNLLNDQLSSGNPIVVDFMLHPDQPFNSPGNTQHFVVVTGVSVDANGSKFVTYIDPYTGESTTQPWNIFSYAWLKNGDDNGAGNGWWMVIPTLPDCVQDPSAPDCRRHNASYNY